MLPQTGRPQDCTRRREVDASGTPARSEGLQDNRPCDCPPVWIAQTKYPWGLRPEAVSCFAFARSGCNARAELSLKAPLKIAQFGLGPIGLECLKLAASKPWIQVIGGIDIAPEKLGADLGALTGIKKLRGKGVVSSAVQLPQEPDLIFHTAVSRFVAAYDQLEWIAARGIDVVSSCEELLFPWLSEPKLAARLDRLCRRSGARLVGTGVNPGFVMDFLPLCLTTISREIRAIHVRRVVNASRRREPLQRKIGSGLPPKEFERRLRQGQAGHAGLKESLALMAHALGWRLARIQETGTAVIASRSIRTAHLEVRRGQTCGLHQRAEARVDGKIKLSLDLQMYLDAASEHDAIQIEGDPPLSLVVREGIPGDVATAAALVNTAPRLRQTQPGLKLVTDLPLAAAPGTRVSLGRGFYRKHPGESPETRKSGSNRRRNAPRLRRPEY